MSWVSITSLVPCGHQHSFQATLECHEEDPEQKSFQLYKESLVQEFIDIKQGSDETRGQWLATGLVAKLAQYEGHHGFSLLDATKFPHGFCTHDEDMDEEVLDEDAISDHMREVTDWWPVMEHLNAKAQSSVKTKAFAKHQVTRELHNQYASQWHIANFRQRTYDLCVQIMNAYANSELKGMKTLDSSRPKATKRKSTASKSEAGPAKKKGYKGVSADRQINTEIEDRSAAAAAADKAGAGILQEEVAARQAPAMGMTFWIAVQGFASEDDGGDAPRGLGPSFLILYWCTACRLHQAPGDSSLQAA
ncbi:hypothetical protein CYMTET_13963 [Cymbomonas tetramitiformis]|uniref:Uncharacterized protein n=1 Tax=Cymbomonas tetramitiformis TaxID=36881 RepID=A0AAE0GHA8_9CHLO|nr:hypothetical protein CYMTET_13963 [Cymbomonas tetramitiformis]